MTYKITNIKVSIKIKSVCLDTVQNILESSNIKNNNYGNFIVVKNKYTFIIFKQGKQNNNHINITNIKSFEDISDAIKLLQQILVDTIVEEKTLKIDNITASIDILKPVDLISTSKIFERFSKVSYNTEKFPGLFAKYLIGTLIVFHTGKCIVIGAKTKKDIECLVSNLAYI